MKKNRTRSENETHTQKKLYENKASVDKQLQQKLTIGRTFCFTANLNSKLSVQHLLVKPNEHKMRTLNFEIKRRMVRKDNIINNNINTSIYRNRKR